jgi:malate/lactate dehydrogenase
MKRWMDPVIEVPVFDSEKAVVIASELNGSNPEMAMVFGRGSLVTARAFGIPVTAEEGCKEKIEELKKLSEDVQKTHDSFKEEMEDKIARIKEEIVESEKETSSIISDNSEATADYGNALKIFFG